MAVEREALAFWAIDSDDAARFADISGVSFDEESDVVIGAREAVMDLAARMPFLFNRTGVKQGCPPSACSPPAFRGRKF